MPTAADAADATLTHADLAYGTDARQVMDVWLAESATPTPCVMIIHGGGWLQGDKKTQGRGGIGAYLKAGISVVSINYRYLKQTIVDSGSTLGTGPILPRGDYPTPPVKVPLDDAAYALQFIRAHAAEWNIDPVRIGVTGASAGGCSTLWLAFHDDLADPQAADPVKRQSTKPYCAASLQGQTSLDPKQVLEWMPNATYGGHAFGFIWDKSDPTVEIRSFLADREAMLPWIREYSPYELVTKDDPPVYLSYTGDVPEKGAVRKETTHSANHGALLAERLEELGVPYEFVHKGTENPVHAKIEDYLIDMLTRPAAP